MKLSVAIADSNALPSAFVVFRGFEASIRKAARMGYDGVELALKHPEEVDTRQLAAWLSEANMEVSCISTGQVYAALGLAFTDADPGNRAAVRDVFKRLIDLAAEFGHMVNIGRIRGQIGSKGRDEAERLFIDDIAYIHFADSNRRAPGQGHIDFERILEALGGAGYDGWIAVEILPVPDPGTAARQAIEYLKPLIGG